MNKFFNTKINIQNLIIMKTIFVILLVSAVSAFADLESIGLITRRQFTQEEIQTQRNKQGQEEAVKAAGPNVYRQIGTNVFNCLSPNWKTLPDWLGDGGAPYWLEFRFWRGNYAICRATSSDNFGKSIAVKNYPWPEKLITQNQIIPVRALQIANVEFPDLGVLHAYDCGTNYVPAALTEEQLAAVKRASAIAEKAAQDKKAAVAARALAANQSAADKGEAYGLLRMGERYRDGDGVAVDLVQARDYFTRAAAAGSPTAAEALSKLK